MAAGSLALLSLPCLAISLDEATRLLDQRNPELAAARIELRGSQGDLLAAGRRPIAELELGTGKYSRLEGLGPGRWQDKRLDSTAGIAWTWERGGKRRLRQAVAGALVDASSLDVLDTARLQVQTLHESYYRLKAAQESLAAAEEGRDLSRQSLASIEKRIRLGDAAPIERERLRVEDLKLDGELRQAHRDLLEAQQTLAMLIGFDGDIDNLHADDAWPEPLPDEIVDNERVLATRPDLRAANERVRATDKGRELANTLRKRDLGLAVEAEREPADVSGVTWGLSVSIPLNGRNHHRGEIARAQADHELSLLSREQLRIAAGAELLQLHRDWRSADERRRLYERELAPAAQSIRDGMELAYNRGGASLTDLLDARRAAREAESDLIQARLDHALAQAGWQAATQPLLISGQLP